jgi:hypothetical protein
MLDHVSKFANQLGMGNQFKALFFTSNRRWAVARRTYLSASACSPSNSLSQSFSSAP